MSENEPGAVLAISANRKRNPFTQIPNEMAKDADLSFACLGFLTFCLSFDDSWVISIPAFRRMRKIGDCAMRSLVKEAIEKGYMKREKYQVKGLNRWRYEVSNFPEFKKCLPCVENQRLDNQRLENPRSTKEQDTPSLRSVVSTKEQFILRAHGKFVKLTDEDYQKLCAERTKEKVDAMIERMNEYLGMTGKKYKDYYLALKKWFRKDDETRREDPPGIVWGEERKTKAQENEKLAKKIAQKFPDQVKKGCISVGYNYIEFVWGPNSTKILFTDHGFREQIITRISTMKLPIEGL